MKVQGSKNPKVDPVNAVKKLGVQHHLGEDNVRSIEGVVEYVRKSVIVFDAEIIQSINV